MLKFFEFCVCNVAKYEAKALIIIKTENANVNIGNFSFIRYTKIKYNSM